jgi:hypothetical protein
MRPWRPLAPASRSQVKSTFRGAARALLERPKWRAPLARRLLCWAGPVLNENGTIELHAGLANSDSECCRGSDQRRPRTADSFGSPSSRCQALKTPSAATYLDINDE